MAAQAQDTASGAWFQDLINQMAVPYLDFRTATALQRTQELQREEAARGTPLPDGTYDWQRLQTTARQNMGGIVMGLVVVAAGIFLAKKVL